MFSPPSLDIQRHLWKQLLRPKLLSGVGKTWEVTNLVWRQDFIYLEVVSSYCEWRQLRLITSWSSDMPTYLCLVSVWVASACCRRQYSGQSQLWPWSDRRNCGELNSKYVHYWEGTTAVWFPSSLAPEICIIATKRRLDNYTPYLTLTKLPAYLVWFSCHTRQIGLRMYLSTLLLC